MTAARRLRSTPWAPLALAALAAAGVPASAPAQQTHALIVTGLGGSEEHGERFRGWAVGLADALTERYGVPAAAVHYLAEDPAADSDRIGGRSTRENVAAALADIASRAGPDDRVLVVLIGHGTSRGRDDGSFNLPGPDLTGPELAELLDAFPTQHVAVVNAASASGPFLAAVSGPRRTVITATRTGLERNETWFGQFFVEAFQGDGADLDKDGGISVLEAYEFARQELARHYEEQKLILTEHAMLDDDGDGEGTAEPGPEAADGALARTFVLRAVSADRVAPEDVEDPVLRALYRERDEIQGRIDALRARKQEMEAAAYERALEALFIELALKNREIREHGGGPA